MEKTIDWKKVADQIKERQAVIGSGKTPKQLALLLGGDDTGWSAKKIRRLLRAGKITAQQNSEGRWFFDDTQVQALVDYATGKAKVK